MAPRAACRSDRGCPRPALDKLFARWQPRASPAPFSVLLLIRTVGGAFVGVLIPLHLASRAIENCSNRLLNENVAGHDVIEFLGSPWALTSQLRDQGLVGGP